MHVATIAGDAQGMTMITEEDCAQWLEQEEIASRHLRISRLAFIANEYGPPRHLLFPGGFVPVQAFEEARWCYVNGQFIGCVLLCQIVLEHILAGLFYLMGKDRVAGAGFGNICAEAERERFITAEERKLFDGIRVKRNPYVHPRRMDRADRIERRMIVEETDFEEIVVKDARLAIGAVFRLLKRHPFAFYEDNEQPSGGDEGSRAPQQ
jgi:hypothetical protein